mmetsp:Transcript_53520/g.120638  ORF Transcript_53520/g.120638 Transcript_53520/m.120638 type:complete len:130 (-) Transcript_53520:63-452(-)
MEEYKGSPTTLVAEVDCTTERGRDLCAAFKVKGYPTLKYGEPSDLKDYDGPRSWDAFRKFAKTSLGPVCGPKHLELCNDKKRASMETYLQMSPEELLLQIRNALLVVQQEVPIMRQVRDHLISDQKGEL